MHQKTNSILVVAKAYPPVVGGVETYSEALVRAYLRSGHSVTVMTQTLGLEGWRKVDYAEGAVQLFNAGKGSQFHVLRRLLAEAWRLSKRTRYSLVHSTTWRPALAVVPFFRSSAFILTVHGREVLNYPRFVKPAMVEILRRADVVVTVSKATMRIAREALGGVTPKGKWVSRFNGISYPQEARSFERDGGRDVSTPVRLLSLARLVPRKNIQGCIAALAELRAEGVDSFEYAIGGRGPMLDELKRSVLEMGLQEHVRFLGYVDDDDLPSLYKNADVFLHPQTNVGEGNDFEGFGLVIADAMSFGCAVVAGSAGGPSDFVCHMQSGMLVDGLEHAALKESIRRLLLDEQLREKLSKAGREYALAELSWDRHVAGILDQLRCQPLNVAENV